MLYVVVRAIAAKFNLTHKLHPDWTLAQDIINGISREFFRHDIVGDQRLMVRFFEIGQYIRQWLFHRPVWVATEKFKAVWIADKPEQPLADNEIVLLYVHGGAFGFGYALQYLTAHNRLMSLCASGGRPLRVLSVEYSLSPPACYPDALNQVVEAFKWLSGRVSPSRIVLGGDSAGGNLALATAMVLRDTSYSVRPAGMILISPWLDLTASDSTFDTYQGIDMLNRDRIREFAKQYLHGSNVDVALISAVRGHANFVALPPILVLSGACEQLSDSVGLLVSLTEKQTGSHARLLNDATIESDRLDDEVKDYDKQKERPTDSSPTDSAETDSDEGRTNIDKARLPAITWYVGKPGTIHNFPLLDAKKENAIQGLTVMARFLHRAAGRPDMS
jgi:acetyl esterase/lipase